MKTSIDLTLPVLPETTDPELFKELTVLYNAIKTLAQGLDDYTSEGDILNQLEDAQIAVSTAMVIFKRGLKQLAQEIETAPQIHADFSELRKQYYRYTVPKFTVINDLKVGGKFACNGKAVSAAVVIVHNPSSAPAGGTGTAAGGWDTAANRDSAIAAIGANAAAITEIQTILKQFGLAS